MLIKKLVPCTNINIKLFDIRMHKVKPLYSSPGRPRAAVVTIKRLQLNTNKYFELPIQERNIAQIYRIIDKYSTRHTQLDQ